MSSHNIGFYEEISKIISYHQISSNTHLSLLQLHPELVGYFLLLPVCIVLRKCLSTCT